MEGKGKYLQIKHVSQGQEIRLLQVSGTEYRRTISSNSFLRKQIIFHLKNVLKSVCGFKDVSDTSDFTGIAHAAASSEMCCSDLVFWMSWLFRIQGDGFASPEEET